MNRSDAFPVRPAVAAVIGIALVAGLLGCSSAPVPGAVATNAPSGAATKPAPAAAKADLANPCTLVTQGEAATALGTDPGAGVLSDDGYQKVCMYGTYPTALAVASSANRGQLIYEAAKKVQTRKGGTYDIAGVGTAAFGLDSSSNSGSTAYFYQGEDYVSILLTFASADSSPAPKVLVLARAAAGRL